MKLQYKCIICGECFTWANRVSKHLKQVHNITPQDYYDKYLKKDPNEGFCLSCGKPTTFIKFSHRI